MKWRLGCFEFGSLCTTQRNITVGEIEKKKKSEQGIAVRIFHHGHFD